MKILLSISLMLVPAFSYAAEDPHHQQAGSLIKRSINSILEVLKEKGLDQTAKREKVMALVDPLFDLPLMAKLVLGRQHWGKFTKAQRTLFTDLFVKQIQDSYFEKVDLLTDEHVEYEKPEATKKGKLTMLTYIISKDQRYRMVYKLYRKKTVWRVYDVEIEGIIVKSYGSQYDQFLQKHTAADLLAKMKEKSLTPPAELEKKGPEIKDELAEKAAKKRADESGGKASEKTVVPVKTPEKGEVPEEG